MVQTSVYTCNNVNLDPETIYASIGMKIQATKDKSIEADPKTRTQLF